MVTYTLRSACKTDSVIKKVNEVFHDVEAGTYADIHPEIFGYESQSWSELFSWVRSQLQSTRPITILDIGTGTGFVPITIAPSLTAEDIFIGTDLSKGMLIQSERNLEKNTFKKRFVQIKDGYEMLPSSSVDVVTINSVLHHIPNLKVLFTEMDRVLKSGGYIIIKHEPNIRFVKNRILRLLYLFLTLLRKKRRFKAQVTDTPIHTKTIEKLEDEGIVFDPPLSSFDLQSLVDIHSPTASGGMSTERGFDPYSLAETYFDNASLIKCKTYSFFGKKRDDSGRLRIIFSTILRKCFPKDGYFFDVVLKKV